MRDVEYINKHILPLVMHFKNHVNLGLEWTILGMNQTIINGIKITCASVLSMWTIVQLIKLISTRQAKEPNLNVEFWQILCGGIKLTRTQRLLRGYM